MLLCPHNWREKIRLSHNLSKACGSPMENPRYYKKIIFSMLLPLLSWSKKAGMMGIVIFFTDLYPCTKNYFQLFPLTKAKVLGLFPPVHLHSATRNYYQLSFKTLIDFSFVNKSVHIITFPKKEIDNWLLCMIHMLILPLKEVSSD